VRVDPIKPTLKPNGTKRLKLEYDGPVSKFAYNFKLRRYSSGFGHITPAGSVIGHTMADLLSKVSLPDVDMPRHSYATSYVYTPRRMSTRHGICRYATSDVDAPRQMSIGHVICR